MPSEAVIQERACGILWNLLESPDCLIPEKDVIMAVAEALRNNTTHAGVVTQSCGALMSFARIYKQRHKEVQHDNAALISSSIGIILDVVRAHQSHPVIQAQGCGALMNIFNSALPRVSGVLWSLLANSHDHSVEARIADTDAEGLLQQAMKRHAEHAGLMKNAHGALRCLAKKMTKPPDITAGVQDHT